MTQDPDPVGLRRRHTRSRSLDDQALHESGIADHIFSAPTSQAGSDNANDPCTKIGQRNSPSRTLACAPPGRTAATHRIVHKVRQESALIAGLALMSPASQQRAQQMPPRKRRAAPLLSVGPIAPRPCYRWAPSAADDPEPFDEASCSLLTVTDLRTCET